MSDHDITFTSYCLGSLNLLCEVSRSDAQKFLRCRWIKNSLLYSLYMLVLVMLWSHDLVMSQLFPTYWIWMLYSYFHLVLHRHNSWLAEHHKSMKYFMSVAYVHNRYRYKYNVFISSYLALKLWLFDNKSVFFAGSLRQHQSCNGRKHSAKPHF